MNTNRDTFLFDPQSIYYDMTFHFQSNPMWNLHCLIVCLTNQKKIVCKKVHCFSKTRFFIFTHCLFREKVEGWNLWNGKFLGIWIFLCLDPTPTMLSTGLWDESSVTSSFGTKYLIYPCFGTHNWLEWYIHSFYVRYLCHFVNLSLFFYFIFDSLLLIPTTKNFIFYLLLFFRLYFLLFSFFIKQILNKWV